MTLTDRMGRVISIRTVTPTFKARKSMEAERHYEQVRADPRSTGTQVALALREWQAARSLIVEY